MTTSPVKSLIDEQLDDLRHTALSQPGQSLPEALGLSPETRLVDTGICSPMTIQRGRKWVEVRNEQ